jgi:hypothetical protein
MEAEMRVRKVMALELFVVLLTALPAAADDPTRITGEVVGMRHAVSTASQVELDRLTVRMRSGEIRHLLLGETGSCPDCVVVGDRVRVRVMAGEPTGEPWRIRTMQVRRTGETLTFRNEAGELVRTRAGREEPPGARTEGVRHSHRRSDTCAGSGRARGAGGPRR